MTKFTNALQIVLIFCSSLLAADRPGWMDEEGIVMAGSWEEPAFRARRAGYMDFQMPPEWLDGYQREHSPQMIDSLKSIGANFVMTHGYKGYGFKVERQGMQDAIEFAHLVHDAGLRVGAYIGSTLGWETLFKEIPDAKDWLWLNPKREPAFYNRSQPHRYLAMKNHPGYKQYIKRAIKFAIEDMQVDLVHLDNTSQVGTGWDDTSVEQFRSFLKNLNRSNYKTAIPPKKASAADPQRWQDWVEYRCQATEQYYQELADYVRSLNPECAVDINPQGFSRRLLLIGIDHGRLLRHGHAYWDESYGAGWKNGKPETRIRSLKIGQSTNNSVFLYSETPLDLAEMMAFNENCLGCITWFESGEIQSAHVGMSGQFDRDLLPYIRFFHRYHDFFRDVRPVADVAILFDYQTVAFASEEVLQRLFEIESELQILRIPYAILFSQQQERLNNYPTIIAAPNVSPSNYAGQILYTDAPDLIEKLIRLARIRIDAPNSVLMDIKKQNNPNRWLLHLVNYRPNQTVEKISVDISTPNPVHKIQAFDPETTHVKDVRFNIKNSSVQFQIAQLQVYKLIVMQ